MVRNRQAVQQCLSTLREPNQHFTVICICCNPLDYSMLRHPVYQLNGAVMANQHSRCEFANGRFNAIWQAFDGQQELVLLRFYSVCPCLVIAEPQEQTDLVTELSQVLQFAD
jgi:hypothetical protein